MIRRLIDFLDSRHAAHDSAAVERALQLSAAVLMVETMRSDFQTAPEEKARMAALIERCYSLDAQEAQDLIVLAEEEADRATSLREFTRKLTDHLDTAEREHLVELLWELAYADGRIDKYEEHLLRRIAELLYIPHSAFIRAKHRAAARRLDG